MKVNQKGFGVVGVVLILVILGIVGFTGYFVWHSKQEADKALDNNQQPTVSSSSPAAMENTKADANDGYLVVKEWGLRFKVPSGLKDVKYVVKGDTAAFYAKPTESEVQYRSDYALFEGGVPRYASGNLYRSEESTKTPVSDQPVEGKKIGGHYYYTSWSFSGLASGAACVGLYGDDNATDNCKAESDAFVLVNSSDDALLKSIELAQ